MGSGALNERFLPDALGSNVSVSLPARWCSHVAYLPLSTKRENVHLFHILPPVGFPCNFLHHISSVEVQLEQMAVSNYDFHCR